MTVPVAYGGLDTDEVAEATGLSAEEIARCHAEPEYQVSAAASVGQPMMTGVDERLQVPRRSTPRTDVPALAVADRQRADDDLPREDARRLERTSAPRWSTSTTRTATTRSRSAWRPGALRADARRAARATRAPLLLPPEPRLPAFRVEEAGPLDLLLDQGRLNQAHHGMAQSGPLDTRAALAGQRARGQRAGHDADRVDAHAARRWWRCATSWSAPRAGACSCSSTSEPVGQITTLVRKGAARLAAADRRRRARLPRARRRDRGRAVPGLDVRRPDRPDRPPARAGRRARPRAREPPRPRDAGAPPGGRYHVVIRLHRGPQWSQAAQDALTVGAVHRHDRRPHGRAPRRPRGARR